MHSCDMKTYYPHYLQRISIGMLTSLFIIGGLIAPAVHRLAHTTHDLEMLFPTWVDSCHDHSDPNADETDSSEDGEAAQCNLCTLSTLGMDIPVFIEQPLPAVPLSADICYVQIRMDALPSMPPSARAPPA